MPFNNFIRNNNYSFSHPYSNVRRVRDLKKKYDESGIVIAFTFDYTVFDKDNTGSNYSEVIELLKKYSHLEKTKLKIVDNGQLNKEFVNAYLGNYSIEAELTSDFLDYDVFLDAKSGIYDVYQQLMELYDMIQGIQNSYSRFYQQSGIQQIRTISSDSEPLKLNRKSIYSDEDELTTPVSYDDTRMNMEYVKQMDMFREKTQTQKK